MTSITSTAFSVPDDPQRKVSIRRPAKAPSSATSSAADEALQHVLDRRLRKREGRLPPPRSATLGSAVGGVSSAVNASVNRFGLPQWLFRAAVLGGVAVILAIAVVTLVGRGAPSHTVEGILLLGKTPLPQASISFHRTGADEAEEPRRFTTGTDGSFRGQDEQAIPAGLYAVVIDSVPAAAGRGPRAPVIPPVYRDPTTTPLRVHVTENLSGLRLLVRR